MRLISLIASGHSTQMQKNTPFQMHMEHSPGETTSWVTNQTSVNLTKLKLYQAAHPAPQPWHTPGAAVTRQKSVGSEEWRKHV